MAAARRSVITRLRRFRSRNTGIVGLMISAVALIAVICWWWSSEPSAKKIRLTITGGNAQGLRNSIAISLADFARERGVELKVIPTSGSQEALKQVNAGSIDLALTQGGLEIGSFHNLQQLAVLHVEPLHLLVKPELFEESPTKIHALHGHTVNLSEQGSGTNALAREVLDFIGIVPGKDCNVTEFSYDQLLAEDMTSASLPDVIFTVSSLPSPVAKELIDRHGLRPVELPFASAFRLEWTPRGSGPASKAVVRRRIVEATIPAFAYGVDPAVPATSIKTLGTRLHLVAHDDIDSAAAERLVDVVYGTQFANVSEPPLRVDLLVSSPVFPLHLGARQYLHRKTPIITERVVEITEQVLAILGTVFGGALFLWQAVSFTRRKRRDRQFLSLIERVVVIEEQALRFEFDDEMTVDDLMRIQRELSGIKAEMIKQFQNGDIEGADALSGFLNHVNDASELLTRVILHERAPRAK